MPLLQHLLGPNRYKRQHFRIGPTVELKFDNISAISESRMTKATKLIAFILALWLGANAAAEILADQVTDQQQLGIDLLRRRDTRAEETTVANKAQEKPDSKLNEIDTADEEQRIIEIKEPYKSMLQTTARFALAQTKLPNHISIDSAMSLLNDALYMLAKPSVLLRVFKLAMTSFLTLVGVGIAFPPANHWMQSVVHDPSSSLNLDRYLSNGQPERSVLEVVSARTDEALNRVGLQASQCRERSLCHLGEILNCFLPHTSEAVIRFGKTHFPESSVRDHSAMMRAFLQGFVDKNCTKLANAQSSSDGSSASSGRSDPPGGCLGSFLTTILGASRASNNGK